MVTSKYHPPTIGEAEQYYQSWTAMLRYYIDANQQNWEAYDSILNNAYNIQLLVSINDCPFDLVLN